MRYISLVKPGILMGNAITLVGGYCFAVHEGSSSFDPVCLLFALLGMCLVVASGCVFNNFIDSDIDALMERTKKRVTVLGLVSLRNGMFYAVILAVSGLIILYFLINHLSALVSLFGLFVYVVIYSLYFKRYSVLGTAIGGVAGAIPPVVGYVAVTGHLSFGSFIIFAILFCWQIPHSYAIAIYRKDDYKAAAIPVLPLVVNLFWTKACMALFVVLMALFAVLPYLLGLLGLAYGIFAIAASLLWLWYMFVNTEVDESLWARKMFVISIMVVNLLCIGMFLG